MRDLNDLIGLYAEEIQAIIDRGTVGDYTWQGLLFTFLTEARNNAR